MDQNGSDVRGMGFETADNKLAWHGKAEASDHLTNRSDTTTPEARFVNPRSGNQAREISSKRGKLQGSRPDCLQCHRLAFWELDFCGPCLIREAKEWDIECKAGDVQYKQNANKDWVAIKYLPLSTVEVHELQLLPPDTRSFCVGNRVSMRVMQSMLANHGRQSQNPLIRQYCLKGDPNHMATPAGNTTPDLDRDGFQEFECSAATDSTWSGIGSHDTRSQAEHLNLVQQRPPSRSYENRHIGHASPRVPPAFRDQDRSPLRSMIGPQRKPTAVARHLAGDDEDLDLLSGKMQQVQAGKTAPKRRVTWESEYSRNERNDTISKRFKPDTNNKDAEWAGRSTADLPKFSKEIKSRPEEEWVSEVLEGILQMEMAARPASVHEVGHAVKKELEKQLMEDIMYGDPGEGQPIYIPLLRELNAAIESEWALN